MNGRDLFRQLQQFGDLDVQESTVLGWIDMCQKKSSLDLPVVQTVTALSVVDGTVVPVPNGVFRVLSASDGYPLSAIEVGANSLILHQPAASVTIKYSSIAPDYTNMDDELTIHPSLHAPMIYFLVSMYYDMEGEGDAEESDLAERFYQRWVYYRNMAIAALTGTDNDLPNREPVETKDVLPRTRHIRRDSYFE
jgi:hypothetical protein